MSEQKATRMNDQSNPALRAWRWWRGRQFRGQSLVEFTVLLPLLLIMLSGLIEFGFMLNDYLDLVDATREVARFAADGDPVRDELGNFNSDPTHVAEPAGFYDAIWQTTDNVLDAGGQLELDPGTDDVIVSFFTVAGDDVTARFPPLKGSNGGENGWRRWENHTSQFTSTGADSVEQIIQDSAASTGLTAPNTGIVLVEIYYDYHMLLGLPWITAFVEDPVTLHTYAIMPNGAVEPTPTPGS